MNVSKCDHGIVVQTWRDVETTEDLAQKYGLSGVEFVATPEGIGPGYVRNNEDEYSIPPIAVTREQVNEERNRRIAAGFIFKGLVYQADPESLANITGVATSALGALMAGKAGDDVNWSDPSNPFAWLASDNTLAPMGPAQVVAFGNAALAHKSKHIHMARILKDTKPIPADYADDSRWGGAG